jgi:hypothetical protein
MMVGVILGLSRTSLGQRRAATRIWETVPWILKGIWSFKALWMLFCSMNEWR